MASWYKWLWSRIGGRPWTFIIRDSWHEWAVLWIFGLLTIGFFLSYLITSIEYLKYLGILLIGYILGHCFWGKKYIHNQQGGK